MSKPLTISVRIDASQVLEQLPLLTTALAIADDAARSDVECYARPVLDAGGTQWFDLAEANVSGRFTLECIASAVATANRAARYIRDRGDALPYRMVESMGWVRFEDKAVTA